MAAKPTPGNMPIRFPLNIIKGIPDSRVCEGRAPMQDMRIKVATKGTASIETHLPDSLFAKTVLYLDPAFISEPLQLGPGPLLNHIADPDLYPSVLRKLENYTHSAGRPCFNHPSSVLRTSRDEVSKVLAGIPGLHIPSTIRLIATDLTAMDAAIAAAGLVYPVLVRIAGDHGGVSMIKVDAPDKLSELYKLNCYQKAVYVTQFADFVSADGRYRKFRIVVIGDKMILRHMVIGDSWLLHAQRRSEATESDEEEVLEAFDREIAPKVRAVCMEIGDRLDLDYFGIDCSISSEGVMTLFEANACMNIMFNSAPSPNMWDKPIADIKAALFNLLRSPTLWRHPSLAIQIAL
jgi:glutathione synthase/RimK-type ligase-like ATP-grasp enzyme